MLVLSGDLVPDIGHVHFLGAFLFILKIIYGCAGSSLLCVGFL